MESNKFESIVDQLTVVTVRKSPATNKFYDATVEDNLLLKVKHKAVQCGKCHDIVEGRKTTISKERRATPYPVWMEKCHTCGLKWKVENRQLPTRQAKIKSL
jgi:NAD-dependent dihydropyrimidine dehydrogenase PreA subunit